MKQPTYTIVTEQDTGNTAKAVETVNAANEPAKIEVTSEVNKAEEGRLAKLQAQLDAQLENNVFLTSRLQELSEKKVPANEIKDEPFFSDADISDLEDKFGEEGAKRYMRDMERVLSKIPKTASIEAVQKQVTEANETASNAAFLTGFDSDVRGKITNSNSELMRFADTVAAGYNKTAKQNIEEIITARDGSDKAKQYIADVVKAFADSKQRPADAPAGTAPKQTNTPGKPVKPLDGALTYTRI